MGGRKTAFDPHQSQVIVHAFVAVLDKRIGQHADDGVVQPRFHMLDFCQGGRVQAVPLDTCHQIAMLLNDRVDRGVVTHFSEHTHGGSLKNDAELISRLGQFQTWLDELDA